MATTEMNCLASGGAKSFYYHYTTAPTNNVYDVGFQPTSFIIATNKYGGSETWLGIFDESENPNTMRSIVANAEYSWTKGNQFSVTASGFSINNNSNISNDIYVYAVG